MTIFVLKMPSSKRRRKQVELRRRQIERARRKLALESENKENRDPPLLRSCRSDSSLEQYRNQLESNLPASGENGKGWWGGLYNWCSSGIIQVIWFGGM